MIIGIVPLLNLDTFISNLEEQDVSEETISVITTSPATQADFNQFTGSLHGTPVNQLLHKLLGSTMPKSQANQFVHALTSESALVAVDLDPQEWLLESFRDHGAQQVWSSNAA